MKRAHTTAIAPIMLVLLAGCGSSSTAKSAGAAGYSKAGTSVAVAPAQTATSPTATAVLITAKHGKLGTILATGSKRLTVYIFEADTATTSRCTGGCASVWPPVLGVPRAGGGALASALGTITRPDGTRQVTYGGHPLYLYARDKDDGDAYGQALKSFGADWYVLAPSGRKIDAS